MRKNPPFTVKHKFCSHLNFYIYLCILHYWSFQIAKCLQEIFHFKKIQAVLKLLCSLGLPRRQSPSWATSPAHHILYFIFYTILGSTRFINNTYSLICVFLDLFNNVAVNRTLGVRFTSIVRQHTVVLFNCGIKQNFNTNREQTTWILWNGERLIH